MSWFSLAVNGVASLFGGEHKANKALDIAEKAMTGIGNWIDEKDFTPEERSKALAQAVDAHIELVKATANENSLRSVTRRWLAWGVGGFVMFWASVAVFIAILGAFEVVNTKHAATAIDGIITITNAFHIGVGFVAVMGLYFGVQFLRK